MKPKAVSYSLVYLVKECYDTHSVFSCNRLSDIFVQIFVPVNELDLCENSKSVVANKKYSVGNFELEPTYI